MIGILYHQYCPNCENQQLMRTSETGSYPEYLCPRCGRRYGMHNSTNMLVSESEISIHRNIFNNSPYKPFGE